MRPGELLELVSNEPVAGEVFGIYLATPDEVLAVGYVSRIINNARLKIKLCRFETRMKI